MLLSIIVGIVVTAYASYRSSRQIGALARKVRNSDPNKLIHLDPIRITEIDQLSSAIEELSKSVAENSSRLSQIIGMLSIQIGASRSIRRAIPCSARPMFPLTWPQLQSPHEDQSL